MTHNISCPGCHVHAKLLTEAPIKFCPHCGALLPPQAELPQIEPPTKDEWLTDRYQLIEEIGKGGMGEVFSAYDMICGRKIALKKIRADLLEHPQIRHRFLKEAHITCQLTHPAIIPIYSIQAVQLSAFYTMPYVEGETLKQILRKTRSQDKKGEKLDYIGGSIPALMRIFITICQAIAYAHSKGVLHRDIKCENIIVGKYGEVLILDWGLAKYFDSPAREEEENMPTLPSPQKVGITRIGKVVGTVSYMAPERGLGNPATVQTDIYALGVILYQLLTLHMPFHRASLKEWRKSMTQEEWIDPVVAAPYRDVPRMLSRTVKKCLESDPQKRYASVDELIRDLENYLEGRSEWFPMAELEIKRKGDWEFQEHILMAEPVAITRILEEAEWVNLMISKQSFTGNIRIETAVSLGSEGHGVGILFSIPEASDRASVNEGYCLWLSSERERSTKLLRSNVEVMQAPDIILKKGQWTNIRIEKIDKSIHLYLDDVLQFSYIAHIPLIGTHIGLLSRDADFEIKPLKVFVGSLNLTVNCLAVPDAFLAHRDFAQALSEYRRIANSFPDRVEGREALFRAGLTFLEQAKGAANKVPLLDQALQEFEKLHDTPGGPWEYLGKALVYQAQNEDEEEIKCFELAYRRYPKHPLLPMLQEQILSRMHQVSRQNRITTYRFLLLTARHFSLSSIDTHTRRLFTSLQKHWEPLPFMEENPAKTSSIRRLSLPLAFWLAQPYILGEIIDELLECDPPCPLEVSNALAAILELGCVDYAETKLTQIKTEDTPYAKMDWRGIEAMIAIHREPLEQVLKRLDFGESRSLLYALDKALDTFKPALVIGALEGLKTADLRFDTRLIWAYLLEKNWQKASEVIEKYPIEILNKGNTPLHFLYGCLLQATEGKEMAMIHFTGLFHGAYPRSWNLASHELIGELFQHGWFEKAFLWEKRQLYRQLSLYYHCSGEEEQSQLFHQLYKRQFIFLEGEKEL